MSQQPQDSAPDHERATNASVGSKPSATKARSSTSTLLLGLLGAALLLAAVLVGLKMFVAEDIPELTQESFQAALQKWEARGPSSYDIDVQIGGEQPGVAHVEVRNGEVTLATRDGLPLQEWNKDEWSIAGQFEMLEREFEFAADPQGEMDAPPGAKLWLSCEFDPEYGYPRRFHRHVTGGAPEVYWQNVDFKAR